MTSQKEELPTGDWEKIPWEMTPYPGVFISIVKEVFNLNNPEIPQYTLMKIKINPGCYIPPHRHNREPGWREIITLPKESQLEITLRSSLKSLRIVQKKTQTILEIGPEEIFGLKNSGKKPLCFSSKMQPGFSGYQEIEEVN